MICGNCHRELPKSAAFCDQCGTRQHPLLQDLWQALTGTPAPTNITDKRGQHRRQEAAGANGTDSRYVIRPKAPPKPAAPHQQAAEAESERPKQATPQTAECRHQDCRERTRNKDQELCLKHWKQSRDGEISPCPNCGAYKKQRYPLCIACNRQNPATAGPAGRRQEPPKPETFDEKAKLIESDPKAEAKRILFDQQNAKCNYCGQRKKYPELEIEHMIPKYPHGGPDNIRNWQLACKPCNQAKGTMTDIEFRQANSRYLPQRERTPATPPIKPELLRGKTSAPPAQARGQKTGAVRKQTRR